MEEQQITLILIRSDGMFDITELVKQIEWSGRKGSAPRTLEVSLLDSSEYERSGINVEKGHSLIFYWNKVELFRGMILKQVDSDNRIMTVKAYDICRYIANNRDSFSYENKTLTYIFQDICRRFQIPAGEVANCNYQIEEMSGMTTTAWDVLCDAMLETFRYTGERYYIYADGERVNLIKRADSVIVWVVETGSNIINYERTRDYSDFVTRVVLYGDDEEIITQEIDSGLEAIFGIFQNVEKPKKDLSTAKYGQIAKNALIHDGKPDHYVDITAIGISDCITGAALQLIIPEIEVSSIFYIDEDTHTFSSNNASENGGFNHIMRLKLRLTNEIQG